MDVPKDDLDCPHCGTRLRAFRMPDGAGWDEKVQWACFNNECSYYIEGWDWMRDQYAAKASYRYRVADPENPVGTPIPVNSAEMLFDLIIDQGEGS